MSAYRGTLFTLLNIMVTRGHARSNELESSDDQDGLIAGRFEILRPLGDGAFAVVYEALDRELGRRVALKLFTSYAPDELESALREARAMARLNHENVLSVHDIGEHRGTPFLAIEYAEMDLRRWLSATTREPDAIIQLFCAAGRGLAEAHREGLVHHDFKPANVLLRHNGTAAVGDFGLARHLDTADEFAQPRSSDRSYALGTLRYIAPERLIGQLGDARSDQFSFCVALWEALAGEHPFAGKDAAERCASISAGPKGTPRAPAHVCRALRKGLASKPQHRFETMDALLQAIERPHANGVMRWVHRGARPAMTAMMLAAVFVVGVSISREAPALDVQITPAEVLTADAAMDRIRDLSFDGNYAATVPLLFNTMPVIRETDLAHQRKYLAELEVLGDVLYEAGAFTQAAMFFAAGNNLCKDLGVDPTAFVAKRSAAMAKTRRIQARP